MTQAAVRKREGLRFETVDDAVAEIQRLHDGGYQKAGNWSLEQIAYHLAATMRFLMRPGPYPEITPEQRANRPKLEWVLANFALPGKIDAPERIVPPADCDAGCIDDCIATLRQFAAHPGLYAPHRVFGELSIDEARRLALVHTAHHLSHLVPNPQ
jgi:hypothetical protein